MQLSERDMTSVPIPESHTLLRQNTRVVTPALSLCVYFGELTEPIREGLGRIWQRVRPAYEGKLSWYVTEAMPQKQPVDDEALGMIPFWFRAGAPNRSRYVFYSYAGDSETDMGPFGVELWVLNVEPIPDQYRALLTSLSNASPDDLGKQANCLRLSFPLPAEPSAVEEFADLCRFVFAQLPFLSGYAGYSLLFDEDSAAFTAGAWETILGLAMRHPGYDVFQYDAGAPFLYLHMKGANWITALGQPFIERFDRLERAAYLRDRRIETTRSDTALLIQAGPVPQIGDVNRGDDLPLYRQVAKAIEPLTCGAHWAFSRIFDEEKTMRWLKRFDVAG